jgi:3D (Asp-Asp-Asp) domain-containing protein
MLNHPDQFEMPKFGIRILKLILSEKEAEYAYGCLEEHYREKVQETGKKSSLWFWGQLVRSAFSMSWEAIASSLPIGELTGRALPRVRAFLLACDWPEFTRQTAGVHVTGSVVFLCLLSLLLVGPPDTNIAEQQPDTPESRELEASVEPPDSYASSPYSLRGKTAAGKRVSRSRFSPSPTVPPTGTSVPLDHPGYSGEYLVADTGGVIRGKRIDIWTPTDSGASRYGRRTVKLTVLSYPGKRPRRKSEGANRSSQVPPIINPAIIA